MASHGFATLNSKFATPNPQFPTLNPNPHGDSQPLRLSTLNSQSPVEAWCPRTQLCTSNPQPSTFNPQPSTLNPQLSTLNPQPSTLNPQPSTLNPRPSTLNLHPSTWTSRSGVGYGSRRVCIVQERTQRSPYRYPNPLSSVLPSLCRVLHVKSKPETSCFTAMCPTGP